MADTQRRRAAEGTPAHDATHASAAATPRAERDFFNRPALQVAPDMLGGVLSRTTEAGTVSLRISEVESYEGASDPASHAYRGKTARCATMFGPPGHLYCYFIYGMHFSINTVCGPGLTASGVLIRAGAVVDGVDLAQTRRDAKRSTPTPLRDLARGPGNVATCFAVDARVDGADLLGSEWSFVPSLSPPVTRTGPRVGVSGAGGDGERFPWRFFVDGDDTVSRFVPGTRPT